MDPEYPKELHGHLQPTRFALTQQYWIFLNSQRLRPVGIDPVVAQIQLSRKSLTS